MYMDNNLCESVKSVAIVFKRAEETNLEGVTLLIGRDLVFWILFRSMATQYHMSPLLPVGVITVDVTGPPASAEMRMF
jgi:hypothetical protein